MKIYYFDIYGRAEPLRMALSYAKVDYEDIRVNKEEMTKMKEEGKLEFGQLPVIEKDGKFYGQSASLLRFIGKKHGMYPEDAGAAWRADSVMDSIEDLIQQFVKIMRAETEEQKKEIAKTFTTEWLPKYWTAIDKVISESGTWHVVGDKLSIADIALGAVLMNNFLNEANPHSAMLKPTLEGYTNIAKFVEGFKGEFAEYLEKRPKCSM